MKYAIWRGCERVGLRPPDVGNINFDELEAWQQANVIAYNHIREIEEFDLVKIQAGAK